jgi:hypothetical protein
MTPKELADKQSEIIFEDGKVLFIKVKGYDAMDYYASERLKGEYNKFNRYGDIYLIVDKDGDNSYLINQIRNGGTDLIDFDGMRGNFTDVTSDYPQLQSKLVEFIKPDNAYEMLLLIKAGKKVDRWDLKSADECMVGVQYNDKNPGKSMIQLQFNEEEYFGFFDFNEKEWDTSILKSIFGGYYGGSYNVIDNDYAYQDWKEGYLLGNLNDENYERLRDIIAFLSPELAKMYKDGNEDSYRISVSKFLDSNFEWFGDRLQEEYTDMRNDAATNEIKKIAIKDIADVFQNYGVFRNKGVFTYYVSTVNVLLSLYRKTQNKNATILELFEELGNEMDLSIGNYHEIGFETYDFDGDEYNKMVSEQLDKMMEQIEDEPEKFERFKEYGETLAKLDKLGYEIGQQYKLPADETKTFRIEEIRKDDSKIILIHWDGMRGQKRSYTYEEFVNYLQSPELFETIVKRLKRIV